MGTGISGAIRAGLNSFIEKLLVVFSKVPKIRPLLNAADATAAGAGGTGGDPGDDGDDECAPDITEHETQRAARRAAEREAGMGKHGGRTQPTTTPLRPGSQSPMGSPGSRTEVTSLDTGATVHHDPYGHLFGDGSTIDPHYGVDRPGQSTSHHTYDSDHDPCNNR